MKKEKSEEKETLEVNKLITKKEKINDNICLLYTSDAADD